MKLHEIIASALVCTTALSLAAGCSKPLNTIPCDNYAQMEEYFRYEPGCGIIISGHRGGMAKGYPENCIESFEHTLRNMPSFFEVDPRMTRDSVVVLMHDSTLERTTTGEGRVRDYTWEELQQLNLVDRNGNITSYRIPTAEEAMLRSRGKTVLNFDTKDVPREVLIPLVNKCGARNVIYTVHTPESALECLALDPDAHFSIWVKNLEQFEAYAAAGVPWSHVMVAYVVSATMDERLDPLRDALHAVGVRCMTSTAPLQDKIPNDRLRKERYAREVALHPDIIETDYPLEFIELYEDVKL